MSLRFQDFHINFKRGLDRSSDPVLSLPAKMRTLINATFEPLNGGSGQSIVMRGGSARINTSAIGGAVYVSPKRIFAHSDSVMLEGQGGGGLTRASSDGITQVIPPSNDPYFLRAGVQTSDVGGFMPRRVPTDVPTLPQGHDCAISGDASHTCWVWEERVLSSGTYVAGLRVVVVREADKAQVFNQLFSSTPGFLGAGTTTRSNPRVVWVNATDPVFYIYCAVWNVGDTSFSIENISIPASVKYSPTVPITETQVWASSVGVPVIGAAETDLPTFDFGLGQDNVSLGAVARDNDVATSLVYMEISSADGVTVLHSHTEAPADKPDALCCLITDDGTNKRVTGLYTTTTSAGSVFASALVFSTAAFTAAALVGSGPPTSGRIIAVDPFYGQPGSFQLFWDGGPIGGYNFASTTVWSSSADKALGSHSVTGATIPGWLLHGRPVVGPSSQWYCTMMVPDANGGTVFVVPLDTLFSFAIDSVCPLARVAAGEVGYLSEYFTTKARVPSLLQGADVNHLIIPVQRWVADLRLAGGVTITPLVQSRADININDNLGSLEVNGFSILAGACPQGYDGQYFNEAGFHHPPVLWSAVPVVGPDNFTAGDHFVIYVEEWQDAQGRLHQGPPSQPYGPVTFAGANDSLSSLVVGTPTQKAGKQLVAYMTAKDAGAAGPYYRAYSQNGAGLVDADLIKGDPLYTSGASGEELPNDPIPSHRQSCLWQNRVWLAGCGDGFDIFFSKETDSAFPPAFSGQFFRRVPSAFGRAVSVQPLGDRLLVLCEKKIGFIYGSGPTATGAQDGYSEILPLIEEMGAKYDAPLSSIVAPEGVWFQSQFGVRLIANNGQLARDEDSDIGSELDLDIGTANLTAVSSISKQQVRFYSSGSPACFMWDEQWKQWSTFVYSMGGAASACATKDTFYFLADDTFVYQEDGTLATDNGSAFSAQLVTNPIQLAGIQGFQRLNRMLLLGSGVPADVQTVTVQGAYDYELVLANLASPADVTLTASGVMQEEIHFARQKCQSVTLSIAWKPKVSSHRMRLTDLALRVGVKRDHAKVPSSKRVS